MSYTIGVDVGGTKAHFVLVKDGQIIERHTINNPTTLDKIEKPDIGTPAEKAYDIFLAHLAENGITRMLEQAGVAYEEISSVGWGLPGTINQETHTVLSCPNLSVLNDAHFAKDMESFLEVDKLPEIPHVMENDANCFALGAYKEPALGLDRQYKHVVAIITGTGVGAGVISNGILVSGKNTSAGEIGRILWKDDVTYEDHCSGRALHSVKVGRQIVDGAELYELVKKGNKKATERASSFVRNNIFHLVEETIRQYNPEAIVFGGSVAKLTEIFLDQLQKKVDKVYGANAPKIYASSNPDVNALGAAYLKENRTKSITPSLPVAVKEMYGFVAEVRR